MFICDVFLKDWGQTTFWVDKAWLHGCSEQGRGAPHDNASLHGHVHGVAANVIVYETRHDERSREKM